jgi:cytochrome c-type biogenesis protein CcmH/NrfG
LKGGRGTQKPPTKKSAKAERGRDKKNFSFEPWQVITGVIVLLLVAFFAYTELTREQPINRPAAQQNPPLPDAAMMQEIEQLQRSVDTNPKDDASLIKLANTLHDAGMHNPMLLSRAISTYGKYLALKPTDPNARVDMGICYFEMARFDSVNAGSLLSRAMQEMETAIKANPGHQPAAFNLGIVNLNAGNLEESSRWFKKAMEIDANSNLGKKAKEMLEQHSFQGSLN